MPDAHGWIRVEDALPEDSKPKWVIASGDFQGAYYTPGELEMWFMTSRDRPDGPPLYDVTHWQPQQYPEPPEDE